jgi:Uncharacterised ACR, YggU family COG1872
MLDLQQRGADALLPVAVQPRASHHAVAGLRGHALKLSLTAPPIAGAANDACLRLLADLRRVLMALAEQYFRTQVAGQAEGTVDAKQRDLACFFNFYVKLYGHDDRREWFKSVTEAFLKDLAFGHIPRPSKRGEGKPQRLSQWTIARTYATVHHFARWIHKHVSVFPLGCPTDGVKAPEEEEPK